MCKIEEDSYTSLMSENPVQDKRWMTRMSCQSRICNGFQKTKRGKEEERKEGDGQQGMRGEGGNWFKKRTKRKDRKKKKKDEKRKKEQNMNLKEIKRDTNKIQGRNKRKRERKKENGWEVRDEMKLKREERKTKMKMMKIIFPQKRKGI